LVFYPLAFAVFPPLSLAVSNRQENVRPSDVLLPLGICLWLVAVTWIATVFATRDRHRRGLVALAVTAWFAGFGSFAGLVRATTPISGLAQDHYLLPVTLVVLVLACWGILRWRRDLAGVSRYLNWVSLLLLLFLPITYLGSSPRPAAAWQPAPLPDLGSGSKPVNRPDIYYVVLDAYTGATSLQATYGFDNVRFETSLRARGFYVPKRSRANYAATFLALAAALNWEYLDWLPERLGSRSRDRSIPYHMIEDNRTARLLKSIGYRVVFFPTAYRATARSSQADEVIPSGGAGQPPVHREFLAVWSATTALRPFLQLGCRIHRCEQLPFQPESPELILWKFAQLAELPTASPSPKFVFAHLLVPHEPYVFRPDCSSKPVSWGAPIDLHSDSLRQGYVEQLQCVNRQLLALVDRLLETSRRPPVIILQADHGNGRFPFGRPPALDDITEEQLTDRTDVFAAYYMPGVSPELYDSITPINVIPSMLRAYFGASIPRLEDRSYYSSWREPYRFTRVH
jgi:hypothetical protein